MLACPPSARQAGVVAWGLGARRLGLWVHNRQQPAGWPSAVDTCRQRICRGHTRANRRNQDDLARVDPAP